MNSYGGWLPGEKEHGQGSAEVCSRHVDPDVEGEGLYEGEQVGWRWWRLLVQDTHSWKREVISWTPNGRYTFTMRNDKMGTTEYTMLT